MICEYCKKEVKETEDYNVGISFILHDNCYKLAFIEDKSLKAKWFRFKHKCIYKKYVFYSFIGFVFYIIKRVFKRKNEERK